MARRVDEQVLRLYVSVHHVQPVYVVESPHELVGVELHQERVHLLLQLLEAMLDPVDIGRDVVHDNVQGTIFTLLKVGVLNSNYILMMHLLVNL